MTNTLAEIAIRLSDAQVELALAKARLDPQAEEAFRLALRAIAADLQAKIDAAKAAV